MENIFIPTIEQVKEYGSIKILEEFPKLHFLFFEGEDSTGTNCLYGICLEFGLFSYGADLSEVRESVVSLVIEYIKNLAEKDVVDILLKDVQKTDCEVYWALYRSLVFIKSFSQQEKQND